ncbi:exodeoxyribonuclease III [Phenylobacterium montanum]|uniref:Exodeoxyribonuclease III n=1 Tax=Phenylobacterium montanum TaxID=2823693 RepID=A0A975FXJ4_9CAUL|nr:exodeoxyribonuclease III [Caulobacter sp. S6]QUD86667.1 exodeoxyribonuclease III [Caulobacter sp. S6]
MRLRICTWNVNSVRLRVEQVARFVAEQQPDVLCMQEIKCQAPEFPREAFEAMGLPHLAIAGQKGWHGVATASRLPLEPGADWGACREGHARSVAVKVQGVEIQNFYIPAGGDIPDRTLNPKFDHKLDFLERLSAKAAAAGPKAPLVITGDFNVAPGEFDVWSHKQMLKIVSHTPIELAAIEKLRASAGFVDLVRETTPDPTKLFSWWSYRAADFRASNRGLRLDHIWATPALHAQAFAGRGAEARIHDDVRAWERPSDHAPVIADLAL